MTGIRAVSRAAVLPFELADAARSEVGRWGSGVLGRGGGGGAALAHGGWKDSTRQPASLCMRRRRRGPVDVTVSVSAWPPFPDPWAVSGYSKKSAERCRGFALATALVLSARPRLSGHPTHHTPLIHTPCACRRRSRRLPSVAR